jgi:hypothetical protein
MSYIINTTMRTLLAVNVEFGETFLWIIVGATIAAGVAAVLILIVRYKRKMKNIDIYAEQSDKRQAVTAERTKEQSPKYPNKEERGGYRKK